MTEGNITLPPTTEPMELESSVVDAPINDIDVVSDDECIPEDDVDDVDEESIPGTPSENEEELVKIDPDKMSALEKVRLLRKEVENYTLIKRSGVHGLKQSAAILSSPLAANMSPRKRLSEKEEDKQLLDDAQTERGLGGFARLTVQPKCIEGGGVLRYYQMDGLNWLISIHERGINGILADEMGLGKTVQTIALLGFLNQLGHGGPHIIIVPKSTTSNWMNEFAKWCPSLRVVKLHGNKQERTEFVRNTLAPLNFDVVVTTYEMILAERGPLKKIKWNYLVIDEAHRIKNEQSRLSVIVRELKTRHRLLLTGTPLQNNLHELWALLNFLMPDVFDSSVEFDSWFEFEQGSEAQNEVITLLHKILRPFMLRRLKSDVAKELPPKKEVCVYIGMTKLQRETYRKILRGEMDVICGSIGAKDRSRLLNVVMQLRKAANHPYLFEHVEDHSLPTHGEHLWMNCGKTIVLDKLLRRLKEEGSRILIFSQMTRMLDILEDFCVALGYKYNRIDGSTSSEIREDSIDEYNRPGLEKFIFLLSTRAGGLGINLASADVVILYDSDWNPQVDLQAQDRSHRIGQTKPVRVYRFVSEESIEEKIVERAALKLRLDHAVIQSGRLSENNSKLSKTELLDAIRFGADKIFKQDGDFTDADVDTLLAIGEQKTTELNSKLQALDENSLLNFKSDGGDSSAFVSFEGSDLQQWKAQQAQLKLDIVVNANREKRDRNTIIKGYDVDAYYKGRLQQPTQVSDPVAILKRRLPRNFQFCNNSRLLELLIQERATKMEIRRERKRERDRERLRNLTSKDASKDEIIEKPEEKIDETEKEEDEDDDGREVYLPTELEEEKREILANGFVNWTKNEFKQFCRLSEKHGRSNIAAIAEELGCDKTVDEVKRYADTFWSRLHEVDDWRIILSRVEAGETRITKREEMQRAKQDRIKTIKDILSWKTQQYSNPFRQLRISGNVQKVRGFTDEEDRLIICLCEKLGYGEWDLMRHEIRRHPMFKFDWFLKSRTSIELGRRCDSLLRLLEKEYESFLKKDAASLPITSNVSGLKRELEGERGRGSAKKGKVE